ncbi:MAG: diguanylate cyclase [Nannocystaceae bacterium]|nr:diguanylate cyclase [Nannocystaceae bacterium]
MGDAARTPTGGTCPFTGGGPDTQTELKPVAAAPGISSNHYRLGVEASPTGLLMVDASGSIAMVNRQVESMFGYGREELLGKRVEALVPERFRAGHPKLMQQFLDNPKTRLMGRSQEQDLRGVRRDGTEIAIEIGLNPFTENGEPFVLASIVDITERKQQESELRDRVAELSRYRYEMGLLSEMSSLLQHAITADEAHQIVASFGENLIPSTDRISAVSVFLTRSSRDGLLRKAHWGHHDKVQRFSPEECWGLRRSQTHYAGDNGDAPPFPRCDHVEQGSWHMCIPMSAHGQSIGLITICGSITLLPSERAGLQRTGKAIADQLALAVSNLNLRESLSTLAIRDPLTGLFNRRHMEASMNRETARAKRDDSPLSVLMLDVDHFKKFNDSQGHQAADQVLIGLGSRLQSHFRESDIACRYGGEEFLVVLPSCTKYDAGIQAEKLRADISASALGVTVSIGIASLPDDGHNWEMVLRRADDALYEAKSSGRNRVQLAQSPANSGASAHDRGATSHVHSADD